MTEVKICGLTTLADARMAQAAGAGLLGFVLADAPRRVPLAELRRLLEDLEPGAARVGVFRDQPIAFVKEVAAACHLDYVQLHGSEAPPGEDDLGAPLIKAFAVGPGLGAEQMDGYPLAAALLEAPEGEGGQRPAAGSGRSWNYALAAPWCSRRRVMLAGGLHPGNVAEAIGAARPWAVDVSSGVEIPGALRKDPERVRAFLEAVRGADALLAAGAVGQRA